MKNIIAITTLLAAGTALANAETAIVAENFFGTSNQTATLKTDIFNDKWKSSETSGNVFSETESWFGPVWNYGLKPGVGDSLSSGVLYYNNNSEQAPQPGNEPSITYDAQSGLASIGGIMATSKGETVAVFWNEITTAQLSSVTDLQLNFTSVDPSFDVAVFYLEDGSSKPSDVKRLALENVTTASSQTLSLDVSQIAKTDDGALKGGKFVLAMRNTGTTWINGKMNNLSWTGTAIPEPSAFGLLAGLGALALAAARRRRSRK